MWSRPCRRACRPRSSRHGAASHGRVGEAGRSSQTSRRPRRGWPRHPDLTGNWAHTDWIGNYMTGGGRRCGPTQEKDCNRSVNQTEDFELYSPSRFGQLNRPTVQAGALGQGHQELDMWTNKYDPVMTCQPLGVPRQGPPRRIYQSENDITFLYLGGDAGGGYGEYRIIPTDGRTRDKNAEFDITYMGNTRGTLGGRHARARLHRVHRYDMAGARRFLPLRSDACRGAIHASGRCPPVRRHGRRPRGAGGAVGVADTNACGATRIPTRACCESEATARRISRPKRPPRRFGTRLGVMSALPPRQC